jgi:hypothetical protein
LEKDKKIHKPIQQRGLIKIDNVNNPWDDFTHPYNSSTGPFIDQHRIDQLKQDTGLYNVFKDLLKHDPDKHEHDNSEPAATIDRRRDIDYIDSITNDSQRIALIILAELVAAGLADFLFIEHPEIADFWSTHRGILGRKRKRESEEQHKKQVREHALNKLTDEEKQVLGIK